jgi:predicted nucleotidyltransferase
MDKSIDNTIKQYVSRVATQTPDFFKAYIFGSFAEGREGPDSDIDIAFVLNNMNDKDKFDLQVQLLLLASKFDTRIEPHPMSREDFMSNTPFVAEIRRSGIEIAL